MKHSIAYFLLLVPVFFFVIVSGMLIAGFEPGVVKQCDQIVIFFAAILAVQEARRECE